jgi:hypothetical protein
MYRLTTHLIRGSAVAAAVAAAVLAPQSTVAARAAESPSCRPSGGQPAFALSTRVLTGPGGGSLTVSVKGVAPGCTTPETIKQIQIEVHPLESGNPKGKASAQTLRNLAAPAGSATIDLGPLVRGQQVAMEVSVETTGKEKETYDLHASPKALLRPDLVVTAVSAPQHILSGRAFSVDVQVAERNGDVGATATLTLSTGASATVEIPAGGSVATPFTKVTLSSPGSIQLDAVISAAAPGESNTSNNTGSATVEVTEFELDQSQVLVPSIVGYGGQFNHRVYAKVSRDVGVTPENVVQMEDKVVALHPQFSRLFINGPDLTDPDRLASFAKTVLLAQRAGTTMNVTWQGGTLTKALMVRLAAVLNDLVQNKGVTNLRWLTIQNEPNSTTITLKTYEKQYRDFDPMIANIRGQVRYMGGDLVRNGGQDQQVWFDYMAANMADILDAWSIHVFWDYWDTQKLQDRLNEVRAIWDREPESGRKPLYVTEYGVRGIKTLNGVTSDPGFWKDGAPITQTNINAFQHAWFDILSARDGYVATSKWDSYFGKYDNGTQSYYMIGRPQDGWPTYPIYNTLHLWTMSVQPGWKVVGLDGASGTKLLAAYSGPTGDVTVIGLDTSGAQLNDVSATQVSYSVGGLTPLTSFHLAVWNKNGDGQNTLESDVIADPSGVAVFAVPLHAVFSLTTLPVQAS